MTFLDLMDRTMRSMFYWIQRVLLTVVVIILIMRDRMDATAMILNTPAEFAPTLLVVGFVIGLVITLVMSLGAYYEQNKVIARSTGEKLAYGMNYLAKNVAVTVAAGILAIVVPGYYYATVGAVPTMDGCLMIGVVTALVVGFLGEKFASKILEVFRDKAKASDARTTKPKTEE